MPAPRLQEMSMRAGMAVTRAHRLDTVSPNRYRYITLFFELHNFNIRLKND